MGKPPAPDTSRDHLPDPTGHDAHNSPYWRIGPILISVGVIESGDEAGRHCVRVAEFGPTLPDSMTEIAGAMLAAGKACEVADKRARNAHTWAEQVEMLAHAETTDSLIAAMQSAEDAGDTEAARLFYDALAWQREDAHEAGQPA